MYFFITRQVGQAINIGGWIGLVGGGGGGGVT